MLLVLTYLNDRGSAVECWPNLLSCPLFFFNNYWEKKIIFHKGTASPFCQIKCKQKTQSLRLVQSAFVCLKKLLITEIWNFPQVEDPRTSHSWHIPKKAQYQLFLKGSITSLLLEYFKKMKRTICYLIMFSSISGFRLKTLVEEYSISSPQPS